MSMSGIEVDPDITTLFNDMKLGHTNKYALFKIENKKKIVIDCTGDPKQTEDRVEDKECYDEMLSMLTDAPRYILYDFGFTNKEGRKLQKLAFIFWCSDSGKIGDKMIYASSKETIKKTFSGIGLEFQANDKSDLDYETLRTEVERKA